MITYYNYHLLQSIHTLGEHVVSHHNHDNGHGGVHHGQGAVLQFPGLDSLAVHVGQLLHLECPLQTRGEVEASTHDQQRLLLVQLVTDCLHLLIQLQHLLDHAGQLLQTLDDLRPPGLQRDPVLGHHQGEHDEAEDLAGVGLGAGHAYLRSSVDVDPRVRLSADGGADSVGDAQDQSSSRLAIPARFYN